MWYPWCMDHITGEEAAMTTVQFKTSGMHCGSCAKLIEMSVGDVAGVESVRSNHVEGLTTVTYDQAVTDTDAIAAAIRAAGYGAEVIS